MRTGILAGVALALIVLVGLLNTQVLLSDSKVIIEPIERAITEARDRDMERAGEEFSEAEHLWEEKKHFFGVSINALLLSEIDQRMTLAGSYQKSGERTLFLGECEVLVDLIHDTLDGDLLTLQNLI